MARALVIILIIICFLGLVGGGVWALDYLAVIDTGKTVEKIPVVGQYFAEEQGENPEGTTDETPVDPLQEENEKLAAEIVNLKKTVGELEQQVELQKMENDGLLEERDEFEKSLASMKQSLQENEASKQSYQQLAKYYGAMKPVSAVKIMNNLSDEVVIGILQFMEDDQVAKILSAMDPVRAAELVDQMRE